MRNLVFSIAASVAAMAAAPLAQAQAAPDGRLIFGVEAVGTPPPVQDVQFLFGGRNYCWYPGGWHGPGFYWCGYAYRRGLGWGGPVGWHGWRSGGPHVARGGPGYGHGGAGFAHGGPDFAHGEPGGGHGGPGVAHGAPGGGHGGGEHGGGHGGGDHGH